METTKAHLNKTELNDRVLWYDGDSTFPSDNIYQALVPGVDVLFVDQLTEDIEHYNNLVQPEHRIRVKDSVGDLDKSWNIPEYYMTLNLVTYFSDRLSEIQHLFDDDEYEKRQCRTAVEISLYRKLNLENTLRAIIYIINTLESKEIVWGVGRGSSVSSYLLYLIGVHDVDSVLYELDIHDFLRL